MCTAFLSTRLFLHKGVADSVGFAPELNEPSMVRNLVDRGGGHLVLAEHQSSPVELEVRCDNDRLPLVGVGENLKVGVERQEVGLVDPEQAGSLAKRGLVVEISIIASAGRAQRLRGVVSFDASWLVLSCSRWPTRRSTCFGVSSPGHSSSVL